MKRFEYKKINQKKIIEHLTPSAILNCPTPNNVLYSNKSYPNCVCTEDKSKQLEFSVPFVSDADYKFKCN